MNLPLDTQIIIPTAPSLLLLRSAGLGGVWIGTSGSLFRIISFRWIKDGYRVRQTYAVFSSSAGLQRWQAASDQLRFDDTGDGVRVVVELFKDSVDVF